METEKCSKPPTRISSFLKKCKPIPSNFKAFPNIFDDHQFDDLMKITLRLLYLALYSPWQNCHIFCATPPGYFSCSIVNVPINIHYSLATIWLFNIAMENPL